MDQADAAGKVMARRNPLEKTSLYVGIERAGFDDRRA
jgi:hypothetical protein